jgi:Methylene-tetrahydrofolate reductase C terminal
MTYADPPIRPAPSWLSLRFLQRYPRLLEAAYDLTTNLLKPFQRWLKPNSVVESLFIPLEAVSKGAIFDCHMCGQCVLHSTGMTCPQTCPKNLRNGPCGGVRANGHCEIIPDMPCIWVQAWERSQHMPTYGQEILHVTPPLSKNLRGTSAWINDFTGTAQKPPSGWINN